MMKSVTTFVFLFFSLLCYSQNGGNYIIIINQDSIPIDLNKSMKYQTDTGEELEIKIIQPNILTYSDDMISFKHDKSFSVSNTEIGEGIDQCMIMRSTGNGFMVQKYRTINPSSLTQLMMTEITKESISYGYIKTEEDFKRKLKSGQTIEGIKATLTYKDEKEIYTVATYGENDEGIIVVTMLLSDDFEEDFNIIEMFLETLELKE